MSPSGFKTYRKIDRKMIDKVSINFSKKRNSKYFNKLLRKEESASISFSQSSNSKMWLVTIEI